jgi:hypothetical protein
MNKRKGLASRLCKIFGAKSEGKNEEKVNVDYQIKK